MDRNEGYEILRATLFDNDRGFAMGYHPKAPSPYVTWRFSEEAGKRDYYWGHYFDDAGDALMDYTERVLDYERQYGVKRVQIEMPGRYKYYLTRYPVEMGAFPASRSNEPDEIEIFDDPVPVEDGAFLASGYVTYTKPWTDEEIATLELRPARDNLDQRLKRDAQAQIVGEWEAKNNVPETKRLTWYHNDFGCYVAKEFITTEKLEQTAAAIQAARDKRPAPIAEQMRAAQELVDKQPVMAVEKDVPDHGGEER